MIATRTKAALSINKRRREALLAAVISARVSGRERSTLSPRGLGHQHAQRLPCPLCLDESPPRLEAANLASRATRFRIEAVEFRREGGMESRLEDG